ncbi:MAG: TIGR02301 family protein [Bauldia sp.]|nr:TIGR02301 family protein [Bauldia sp.]
MSRARAIATAFAAALLPAIALAQEGDDPAEEPAAITEERDPVYANDMERLAEILGALHYLTELCEDERSPWRDQMAVLIEIERPSETRRARLVDRFNIGYSAFATVHRRCTDAAAAALLRYREEGADLAQTLASRYGPAPDGANAVNDALTP